MQLKTATLNGKAIGYSSETVFEVQVGKGYKGSYKTKYTIKGDLRQALFYYESINIGKDYKKRLYMPSAKSPVIAKFLSSSIFDPRKCSYNL
jgi:hypothetical protein